MFLWIFLATTGFKILLLPAYFSTDFEVHRNWMAITHNLPMSQWYYEKTSEWTLDYPPLFAHFEWLLSHVAKMIDPEMVKIENLNYNSTKTVVFQRGSVIAADVVYAIGVRKCLKALNFNYGTRFTLGSALLLTNVGLLMVDHIHFQYNGLLLGILLISISLAIKRKFIQSALLFSILINMKHIYLYVAPVFGVFYLKFYCWENKRPFRCFLKLLGVSVSCCLVSLGPFYQHIPQLLTRLFPFKRGLTHAYWAPNIWTLYNCGDKALSMWNRSTVAQGKWTAGLVQNYDHQILPKITPFVTFVLTISFMVPCLIRLFFTNPRNYCRDFFRAIVVCSLTSFMFGWHVHEKAILMVVIPLSFLSLLDYSDAKLAFLLTFVAHWSLHPLLFKANLLLIKYPLILAYQIAYAEAIKLIFGHFQLNLLEKLYLIGYIPLLLYHEGLQYLLFGLSEKLPFLPLLLTSLYCSLGVLYCYIRLYLIFLSGKSFSKQDIVKKEESKTAVVTSLNAGSGDKQNQKKHKKKTKVQ